MATLHSLQSLIGGEYSPSGISIWVDRTILALSSCFILVLATRLLSGSLGSSKSTASGQTVPLVPYWIPIIGHLPGFLLTPDSFFEWLRKTYSKGVFALNLGGSTHNVIFKPALGHVLLSAKSDVADSDSVARHIVCAVFGFPKTQTEAYNRVLPDLVACYKHLMSNPGLAQLIDGTANELKKNINNLVTFSTSPVDMEPWERNARPKINAASSASSGERCQEISLLELTRDFVALNANPSLFGTDFMRENEPSWADLWTLDKAFFLLATGFGGRWLPLPALTRARAAQHRLTQRLTRYELALQQWHRGADPGPEWADLDNISDLMKARMDAYEQHNLSIEARVAYELTLMWAMNANANPLIFWVLSRVYADPQLLSQIRAEVAPYVHVRAPTKQQQFPGVREAPVLQHIDHEGLATHCPLLKAAYIESCRVDTATWSFKIMRQDLTLSERGAAGAGGGDKFVLRKGTYCHVAHEMHHADSRFYAEPDVWRVARHIRYEPGKDGEPGVARADLGTVRPYGGGHSMCKGRAFAMKEILMFTAAIFTFWDMDPVGAKWEIPKGVKTTGTKTVGSDMRVKIRRRNLDGTDVAPS